MKKSDVPQDWGPEAELKRLMWAQDENGKFVSVQSVGWDVSNNGFDEYWCYVGKVIKDARDAVARGEKSPLYYWMRVTLLDERMLADYLGIWTWRIKRHMRPAVFATLSPKLLAAYAETFQITPEQVVTVPDQDPDWLPIRKNVSPN